MSDQNDKSSSSGSEDDEGKGERFRSTVRKVSPSEQDLRKKIGYSRGDSESRSPASSPEKSRSRASSESSRSPKRRKMDDDVDKKVKEQTPAQKAAKEMKQKEQQMKELLTTRTGGAYIPPAKLRLMQEQITDKASPAFQRLAWEALKKSINGLINKVNSPNIAIIVRELFAENIVRGRGLLCQSIMQAQTASPTFTHVYAGMCHRYFSTRVGKNSKTQTQLIPEILVLSIILIFLYSLSGHYQHQISKYWRAIAEEAHIEFSSRFQEERQDTLYVLNQIYCSFGQPTSGSRTFIIRNFDTFIRFPYR